jgi:hypothetical protein
MSRFSLNLNMGESAKVTVCFDFESDCDDYGINWETLEVWYKGIDIVDTLDFNDLQSIEKQVKQSWDEIEEQIKEQWYV